MPELAVKGSLSNPFEESWSEFTPKASLSYRMNEDAMFYGLYSKGFRAGGFNGRPGTYDAAATPYDPETVDNFEVGAKTDWLDGSLRLNGSVFFMKYDDKQEEQSVPTEPAPASRRWSSTRRARRSSAWSSTSPTGLPSLHAVGQPRPHRCQVQGTDRSNQRNGPVGPRLAAGAADHGTISPSYDLQALGGTFSFQATGATSASSS